MAAVEGLIAGESNCMAGVVNGDVLFTPFIDCVTKTKEIKADHLKLIEILSI